MAVHLRLERKPRREGEEVEWLEVIWACNAIRAQMFLQPEIDTHWSPDCYMAEIYPDANVIFRKDNTVSIVGRTTEGDHVLRQVAAARGINYTP